MSIDIEPAIFQSGKRRAAHTFATFNLSIPAILEVGFRSLQSIKLYSDQSSSASSRDSREGAPEPESVAALYVVKTP